jgi:cell wall-associated NlpC family hydrolase
VRARRALAPVLVGVLAAAAAVPARASADPVGDKQRQVQRIADQVDALGDRAASLGERYNGAVVALQQAEADVAAGETRLAELEAKLGTARSNASRFAVRAYMFADQMSGVAALLAGTSIDSGAAQRQGYTAVALGNSLDVTDDLKALSENAERERAALETKQQAKATLVTSVEQAKQGATKALGAQQQLLTKTKGELATLVVQERRRRQEAAARAALQAQQAAVARSAASPRATSAPTTSPPPAGAGGGGAAAAPRPAPTRPAPPPIDVPATSPGAAVAVRAALSQVGVPYVFAAAQPGVGFDCSGLTMWAWAQAGVSLPHFAAAQYNSLPHVPADQLQPGDLVFFYPDLGHMGMYIGNGQFVHAPRTGDVVKVSALSMKNFVGAARPG